jgi:hypothetical protein
VLRSVGLLNTKPIDECAGGQLAISQLLNNRDASLRQVQAGIE